MSETSPGSLDEHRGSRFRNAPTMSVERHLQTILTSCVLLGIAWATSALVDLKTKNAEMNVSQAQLVEQVREVRIKLDQQSTERYSPSMAAQDFARTAQSINELRDRLDRLERKGRYAP